MATIAEEAVRTTRARPGGLASRLNPTLCFWVFGLIFYGGAATRFAGGHFLNQIPRDLWQHLAALKALIADPSHPLNPFVPTDDVSRHFHPYWVGIAELARFVHWNEWQAIIFAGYFTGALLLAGIFAFGRTFYRDEWGPLALIAAMTLSWLIPVSHTGYHSMGTLIEGIAYPAVFLIALSFFLWTFVIRALQDPRWSLAVAAVSALMFATHPLGAGIGFIVASCFIAFTPDAALKTRAITAGAIAVGLLVSTQWPYFNPFSTIRDTGNATWVGGVNYYGVRQLIAAFVPSALGLIGLTHPRFRRQGRPVLIACAIFFGLFMTGLFGVMIATRFINPLVLMLHVGMGALFLVLARNWATYSDRRQLSNFAGGFVVLLLFGFLSYFYLKREAKEYAEVGNVYAAAQRLARDIPDAQPIAAYDVTVWPFVANGQRALSVPWPEPGIPDLARRQTLNDQLFDPRISREQRIALARRLGVRSLIADLGGPLRRKYPEHMLQRLREQSIRVERSEPFLRFDLY